MKKTIIFLLGLFLLLAGCEPFFEFDDYVTIEGWVVTYREENEAPVEGAFARAMGREIRTDSKGYFELRNVPVPQDGYRIEVEIRARGYATKKFSVSAFQRGIINLDRIYIELIYEDMARASGEVRVGAVEGTSTTSALKTQAVEEEYVPGQVLISRREKTTELNVLREVQGKNIEVVEVPEGMTVEEAIVYFQDQPDIIAVEPNHYVYAQSLPNDPEFKNQWNLKTINYPGAWFEVWENDWNKIRIAAQDVWIGVLDTGITEHEDLDFQGNILFHRGENLLDPGKGIEPYDYTSENERSHGTHVTGIMAAMTNNRLGIAAAAPGVRIVPWRVLDRSSGPIDVLVEGIYAAVDEGVDIINMSLGTSRYNEFLHEAIQDAYDAGILLVAAAGNTGTDRILYPAAFEEVIAVGAMDPDRRRAEYSNYGPELELMAPGTDVISLFGYHEGSRKDSYGAMSGTSMAAPHVSALAALIMAEEPALDLEQVRFRMRETAGNFYFPNEYVGYGAIDVFRALAPDLPPIRVFAGVESDGKIILKSEITEVTGGTYTLYRVEPGNRRIYAWIDAKGTGKIDEGDYFARSSTYSFSEGRETSIETLNLLHRWEDYFSTLGVKSLEIVEEE